MKGFCIGVETNIGEEQRWNVNSARTVRKRAGAVPGANTRVLHGLGISLSASLLCDTIKQKRIYPRAEEPVLAHGRAFLTPQERLFRLSAESLSYTGKAGFARRKTFFRLIIRKKRRYGTTKTAYLPDRLRDAISVLQLSDCQFFLLQPQLVRPC